MSGETTDHLIGRLAEGVEGLRRDFERADAKADQHRKQVFDRLLANEKDVLERHAENAAKLTAIITKQEDDAARIGAMEPEIESLRRLKQRGIGVLAAVGILSTLLGVTIADGWGKVIEGVRSLFGIGSL